MNPLKAARASNRARNRICINMHVVELEPRTLLASAALASLNVGQATSDLRGPATALGPVASGDQHQVADRPLVVYYPTTASKFASNDFDGDQKSDQTVYDPTTSIWYVHNSSGIAPTTVVWGRAGSDDIPLTGDFDGDGKADLAVYSPPTAIWSIRYSSGIASTAVVWGRAGGTDIPLVGDIDRDGKVDLIVYDPTTSIWSFKLSSTATPTAVVWGSAGSDDIPLMGDIDGDGKLNLLVYNPTTHRWFIGDDQGANPWFYDMLVGVAGLEPTMSDFTEVDYRSAITLYQSDTNTWYYYLPQQGQIFTRHGPLSGPYQSVQSHKITITGDYDSDGLEDFMTYEPSTSHWTSFSGQGSATPLLTWGRSGSSDMPMSPGRTPTVAAASAQGSASVEGRSSVLFASDLGTLPAALSASASLRASANAPSFPTHGRLPQANSARPSSVKQSIASPPTAGPALTFKRAAPSRLKSFLSPG
jgi:hypothetical protein